MPKPHALIAFASRFTTLAATLALAAFLAPIAHAQTTLNATLTATPATNSAALATGSGLTLNLALGLEYLIVGGGGGGGGKFGGGGGAGAWLSNLGSGGVVRPAADYPVTVGAGGVGGDASTRARGANGGSSTVFGLTAIGGGGGGTYFGNQASRQNTGSNGGSGGGGAPDDIEGTAVPGGSRVTAGQGNDGGSGFRNSTGNRWVGGGGGGAGSVGQSASSTAIGDGGAGITSAITGVNVSYAGGGGGGSLLTAGTGGSGIGGDGGFGTTTADQLGGSGAAGTGSGGGGAGNATSGVAGGSGGSGVVIVRYRSVTDISSGGNTSGTYTDGGTTWQYERFTADGTLGLTYDNANLLATQSGVISGSGRLTYDSAGTLALTGTNTYTGGTTLAAGVLNIGSAGALGSTGTISFTGGTLQFSANNTTDYSSRFSTAAGQLYALDANGQNVTLATALTSSGGSLTKSGLGTLTLGGANTYSGGTTVSAGRLTGTTASLQGAITNDAAVEFAQATDGTYSGAMSGSGSLTKSGAGAVTLSGNNTYSGGTTLAGGVVALGSAGALGSSGTISFDGGTLQYSASNTTDYSGRFSTAAGQLYALDTNGQNVSLATALTSSGGSLTKSGLGTLTLGGANTYSGGTTVSAGRLTGTTDSLQGAITNNAAVEFAQATDGTYSGAMTGSGSLTKSGAAAVTLSGTNSYSGGTTISAGRLVGTTDSLQGAITNNAAVTFDQASGGTYAGSMSGTGSLTKTGAGAVILAGANTYSGSTTISAGTLQVGNGGTAGDLGGSGSIANDGTLAFNRSDAVTLARAISGSGGLVKSAAGNLILSGTNTYTGPTSVDGGRLSVNGSLGNTAVTVANGGTLGGSGSIAGTLAVQSGGTLAPGNSIESLSGGTATFAGGATFAYEVDSAAALGVAADLLVVNGDLNLSTDVNDLSLLSFVDIAGTPAAFTEDSTVFAMINYTGAWNGGLFSYNGTALADGSRFSVGSQLWEIDYDYVYNTVTPSTTRPLNFRDDYAPASGTQTFVTITAVPEPATLVLLAAAAGLALLRRARCPSPLSGTRPRPTR